jgi:hypothetical protein
MNKSYVQQAYEAGRLEVRRRDKSRLPRFWNELEPCFQKGFAAIVRFVQENPEKKRKK